MNGGLITPTAVGRVFAYLGLAVLGSVVGVGGALVQGGWFPGGLLLALLGVGGLCYGGTVAMLSRTGGLVPLAGWLIAVLFLAANRPEGDFLFGAGLGSYAFLLGGMIVAVMCATVPKLPQPDLA
ncbi:DUF6113 family protein [Streptomyces sp. NPDC053048]|uniref:DUF6113 family protein n=1 Tax=Streptomyces sp. NPDC053048 TaxID=3365694 RepID=UPI0037CFDE82